MATTTTIVKGFVGDGYTSATQPESFPDTTVGLAGWNYRKPINYTGGSGAGTDYQLIVKCYYGSGTDGTETLNNETVAKVYLNQHCKTDFSDVRFALQGSSTEYVYKLCSKTDSDNAVFALKASESMDSARVIYVYSGNAAATDNSSNSTFIDVISGTVAQWPLNETTATDNATDFSGNNLTGTPTNTSIIDGPFVGTKARAFTQNTDKINFGNNAALDLTTAMSMFAFIKPTRINFASKQTFMGKNFDTYELGIRENTAVLEQFLKTTISGQVSLPGQTNLTADAWVFVASSYESASKKITTGTTTLTNTGTTGNLVPNASNFTIGQRPDGSNPCQLGICCACVLSAVLTDAQRTNLASNRPDLTLLAGKVAVRKKATTTAPSVSSVGKLETRETNLAYKINEVTSRAEVAGKAYTVASTARGHLGWAVIVTEN